MKMMIAALALFMFAAISFADEPAVDMTGKDIFLANKCSMCHSIASQGITAEMKEEGDSDEAEDSDEPTPPDLSNVGNEHEQAWIANFLLKKETLNDMKHPKRFTGTDEELTKLTGWLASLKKEEKAEESK